MQKNTDLSHELLQQLESKSKKKIQLRINDNRSTMLSVRWEPDCTRVSLHRMFLEAPQNIMEELACYIQKEKPKMPSTLKIFIEDNMRMLDYSNRVDTKKLHSYGSTYNLQTIYDRLNTEYFNNSLSLSITWFGLYNQRSKSRVTFGLFYDPLKLIKVHRLLDTPAVPAYVVEYVVYHEMLHYVCPAYHDEKGLHRIHNKEFKEREKEFKYYKLAQHWIAENHVHLFKGMF